MDRLPRSCWSQALPTLLTFAASDLDEVGVPAPTMAAFAGDEAVAIVGLRPFEGDGVVQALVEVLSLLLPLGVDRVALSLPGHAWSLDDPIPPATDDADLRTPVLMVLTADAHVGRCRTTLELHPFEPDAGTWRWGAPVRPEEPGSSTVEPALRVLLDGRAQLLRDEDDLRLAAQLGRVLLLGHELALAPAAARRLELASTVS